jgi:hypothetical protein
VVWDAHEAGRQRFHPLRKPMLVTPAVGDLFAEPVPTNRIDVIAEAAA